MKNLTAFLILLCAVFFMSEIAAQVSINSTGNQPDNSAMLDVQSNNKGLLIPRLTNNEIKAISDPVDGLLIFNSDLKCFYFFDGTISKWREIAVGSGYIFTDCGTVTDYDLNTYNTVKIYSQCWMLENLKTTHYNNSNPIPHIPDPTYWASDPGQPAFCWYDNNDFLGTLYNWYAVNTGMLCPTGWHVPTDSDWKTLEMNLGMTQAQADAQGYRGTDEGGQLKEEGTSNWLTPNTGATNTSGYTALPEGMRLYDGSFLEIEKSAFFWTATQDDELNAWARKIYYIQSQVYRDQFQKKNGFSVRCVKD